MSSRLAMVSSLLIATLAVAWLLLRDGNDAVEDSSEAMREAAVRAYLGGRRDEALRTIDDCLESAGFPSASFWERPDSVYLARELLELVRALREYGRVEVIGSALVEAAPEVPEGHLAVGLASHQRGELEIASKRLHRAIELSHGAYEVRDTARIELAIVLRKAGDLSVAIDELIRLLLDRPYSRRGYLELGACLEAAGASTARGVFAMARWLEPGALERRRAEELGRAGRTDLATRSQSRALVLQGRFREARRLLDRASRDSGGVAVYRVEHLIDTWRAREADMALLQLESSLGRNHPDVLGWRAMQEARLGNPQASVRLFLKLLSGSPELARVWAGRLAEIIAIDLERPERALPWLERLEASGDSRSRELLAHCYLEIDRPREVIRLFSGTGRSPQSALAVLRLLRARLALGGNPVGTEARLARLGNAAATHPDYELARSAWFANSGKPGGDVRSASVRARALALGRKRVRRQLENASRTTGEAAVDHLLAAAKTLEELGAREESLRVVRIATGVGGASRKAWIRLAEGLDGAGEVFLRVAARRASGAPEEAEAGARIRRFLLEGVTIDSPAALEIARSTPESGTSAPGVRLRFTELGAASGVDFHHVAGTAEKDFILGINGGGVALFDFDGDGRTDIFLVNGSKLGVGARGPSDRLFRNIGDFRFEDVTDSAGLTETAWGCGAVSADYDNDGDADLFVTNWGPDRMWRNEGDGTFTDVTETCGVRNDRWGSSATFFDYDRDGHLDLFVANYLAFDPRVVPKRGIDPSCQWKGLPVACGPNGLPAVPNALFRNRGDGTFEDVSEASGITSVDLRFAAYALGVVVLDADVDGWLDLFVANDTRGNLLFRNRRDGTFEEIGVSSGVAFNDDGVPQSGMGVDAAFLGDRATEDIFVVNFADDTNTLYRNEGDGVFFELTGPFGLAGASFRHLGWGTFFFDVEGDGDQDLFIANGHVAPQVDELGAEPGYAQENQLFVAKGERFELASLDSGDGLEARRVSRGAAFADLDLDGDPDIVINELDSGATVLRNDSGAAAGWVAVRLRGTRSNRDGIGAVVTLEMDGRMQRRRVRCGSSFASQSELLARFGVGSRENLRERAARARLHVEWPSGLREQFPVRLDESPLLLVEGAGEAL